jgi:hypothetical protein
MKQMGGTCGMCRGEERCMHVWWGNLRESGNFEDICIDRRIIVKLISEKSVCRAWTGLMWLKIGTNDRRL